MSFMEEILDRNIPIWDRCIATPFVQGIKSGNLDLESFKTYMIQDSIYLKHYARIYGKAIYHAATLKDIQFYHSVLAFVTDAESAVRLKYLNQFGITDADIKSVPPLPETRSYIDFLFQVAERGDSREILGFHTGLRGQPVCPGLSEYVRLRGTKMHGALRPKVRRATPRL